MNYKFIFSDRFRRDLKSLHKKNPHLQKDLVQFKNEFDPHLGDIVPDTGGARKIRMKMTGKGKSGSYRVIYYFNLGENVFFLTIYAKGGKEDLTNDDKKQIRTMIEEFHQRG